MLHLTHKRICTTYSWSFSSGKHGEMGLGRTGWLRSPGKWLL